MKRTLLSFVLLLAALAVRAQKQYVREQQTWLGVFNQTRFSQHWGTWTDLHLRLHDHFVQAKFQTVTRLGLTYYLTDDVRLTGGYAYVHHFPDGARTIGQAEHRPWQQVQWFSRFPQARLMQWVRLEERFRRHIVGNERTAEFDFNWRTRYNLALFLPLTRRRFEPGSWQVLLNNELMVNFGKEVRYNYFDQNRAFAGVVFQVSRQAQLQAGYMHLFQQLPAGSTYRNQHTIRVFYFHNLNFRPTAATPPATPLNPSGT
ncbi:DUF2490 domain-containing protein [Hymenobacter jeollabukensis]|uniref:DUF2490 domain-containing protein n=1 Tax=Hymenobacter jeollabukensis TaxID=2025313 RepID=A0A5R8WVZ3_9BACT|nr:DUF2490 domain-containing protein [Hymenobacter jeollabukensis]TLM95484.1 DUF2490 domain-containing protein [Hymenobacter jeollabukensis]